MITHVGLPYNHIDEFLAGVVPFMLEGVREQEAVIAVSSPGNLQALGDALGDAAGAVALAPAAEWYTPRGGALRKYLKHMNQSGAQALRILGEPIGESWDTEDIARWTEFESGSNWFLRETPVSRMCAYDMRNPSNTTDNIEASHPLMGHGAEIHESAGFIDPHAYREKIAATRLSVPESGVTMLRFNMDSLMQLRRHVQSLALDWRLTPQKAIDLTIAVSEAAGNALEHGGGHGLARIWHDAREIVCDVINCNGRIEDPFLGYLPPPLTAGRGRGFWLMRQLCDWVQIRVEGDQSVVRLHMRFT